MGVSLAVTQCVHCPSKDNCWAKGEKDMALSNANMHNNPVDTNAARPWKLFVLIQSRRHCSLASHSQLIPAQNGLQSNLFIADGASNKGSFGHR